MKKIVIIIAMAALLFPLMKGRAANPSQRTPETAAVTLQRMIDKFVGAPSIRTDVIVEQNGYKQNIDFLICGNCFRLDSPELKVWYNGKTQWSYMLSAGEVNISEPDAEELAQINPFAVLQSLKKDYNVRRASAPSGGKESLLLTPKSKQPFKKIEIIINSSTLAPLKVTLTATDGMVTSLTTRSFAIGEKVKNSEFVFSPKLYPGVSVVDLR